MKKLEPLGRAPGLTGFRREILLFLFLLAVWFFGHSYRGIRHDGLLYAVQALHRLYPAVYGNDLFFLFGSQDDFTLFTSLYAAFVDFVGLNAATIALLLAGFALWIAAAMLLVGSLVHGFEFWLALTFIFALPGTYIPNSELSYAEPFLTARLPAEAFTLFSLAMMLRGKWVYSFAALLVAFAFHPLMALGGGVLAGLHVLRNHWKWGALLAVAGVALAGILAFAGISPFDRAFHVMDGHWYRLAVPNFTNVSPQGLQLEDWNPTLFSLSLLSAAAFAASGRLRAILVLVLVVGLGGIALTAIGTLFFHNLLLIQLQLWRALWIATLFSYIAAAWLISEFWRRNETYRLLLLGFLTAWFTLDSIGGILSLLVCVLFMSYVRGGKDLAIPRFMALPLYFLPFVAVDWWLVSSWLDSSIFHDRGGGLDYVVATTIAWLVVTAGAVAATVVFLLVWRHAADSRKLPHLATVAGVLFLLGLALAFWDGRSERRRYYERAALHDPIPSFTRLIPANGVVYWEDDVKMAWLALGRANYASLSQSYGRVFSRQAAIEAKRRMDRLAALGVMDRIFDFGSLNTASRVHLAKIEDLLSVCQDPVLDFAILTIDLGNGVVERYSDKISGKDYYLYNCNQLRRRFADTWESSQASKPATRFINRMP